MPRDIIPFHELTTFENLFQKALESTGGQEPKHFQIHTEYGTYHFQSQKSARYGLPGSMSITGPTFSRYGKPKETRGNLGVMNLENGKTNLWGDKATTDKTKAAIEKFMRSHGGVSPDQLSWDFIEHEGWGYLLKISSKRDGSRSLKKEVALVSAEAPGQKLVLYSSDGKRRLTYDEERRAHIPTTVLTAIRKRFSEKHVWENLVRTYVTVKRPVSAWEDGPGARHFPSRQHPSSD